MAVSLAAAGGWVSLATPPAELLLANTLVTGQSFRWRRTDDASSPHEVYTGVVGQRLIQMRQLPDDVQYRVLARSPAQDPAADAAVLHDYFNLGTPLSQLSAHWACRDPRYALVAPALPGCRMLRQDPVECLFQFICSSNNHISRIHGMVERLCSTFGTPLLPSNSASGSRDSSSMQPDSRQQQAEQKTGMAPLAFPSPGTPAVAGLDAVRSAPLPFCDEQQGLQQQPPGQQQQQQQQQQQEDGQLLPASSWQPQLNNQELPSFFTFPTLEQLAAATEEALRADGFGYRAKYIVGSVAELLDKPGGGRDWLLGLRDRPYAEAHEALCSLPGVGPKVAACICLFSLDKHDAIPVDTHVWDLATRYYAPHLAKKALTPKLHAEVQQAFVDRFGPYAGWAHNCLFVSELASHKHLLPSSKTAAAAAAAAAATVGAPANKKKRKTGQPLPQDTGNMAGPDDSDGMAAAAAAVVVVPGPDTVATATTAAAACVDSQDRARRRRRKPAKLRA